MEKMCAYKSCPMFSAPCRFSDKDIRDSIFKTTICPIGEGEYLRDLDPENTFFCLVVGSRSFSDYSLFSEKLRKMLGKYRHEPWEIIIVSGEADGTDSLAEKFADEHKYHMVVIKADWDMNGKRADYIQNEEMHRFISGFPHRGVMAFWDGKSRETQHCFELAKNIITRYEYAAYRKVVENVRVMHGTAKGSIMAKGGRNNEIPSN